MKLQHKKLTRLLQKAYSAEKAAAFAYQGHAASVHDTEQKKAIRQIELDEWHHRHCVLEIMIEYQIPVSKLLEARFYIIGKVISASCHVIGWFMPFYFAGSLESGNVCEYFRMKQYFSTLNIHKHDALLYEMGVKEKEHEIYFYNSIKDNKLLPFFEKWFQWGKIKSKNNMDLDALEPLESSHVYCNSK